MFQTNVLRVLLGGRPKPRGRKSDSTQKNSFGFHLYGKDRRRPDAFHNESEVWTRALWILRVPPDKRAFSRDGMLVCQPWLWPDTFRHYQFQRHHQHQRHNQHQQQHRHHQQPWMRICTSHIAKQNRLIFFPGLLRILRAFSGFAGLLRFCGPSPGLRAPPTSACSLIFIFYFSKKNKTVEKALSTWEKPMAKNEVPYSKNAHRLFPGVSCLLIFFSSFFFRAVFPSRFCVALIGSPV